MAANSWTKNATIIIMMAANGVQKTQQ